MTLTDTRDLQQRVAPELPDFRIETPAAVQPAPASLTERLRSRRKALLTGAVALVAFVVLTQLFGTIRHDQRQRHLAHEFTTASADIQPGEAQFVLQIPRIGINEIVVSGASSTELRGGPGHVIGTADIDDGGNVVVLGRSVRSGAPFGSLDTLVVGDAIVVGGRGGQTRAYTVSVVEEIEDSLAVPLRGRGDQLTLVASAGDLLPRRRTMVVATADQPLPVAVTPAAAADDAVDSAAAAGVAPDTAPTEASSSDPGQNAAIGYVPLKIDALDERSTPMLSTLGGLLLCAAALWALVRSASVLAQTYSRRTIGALCVPLAGLVVVVLVVLVDGIFPSTF